MEKPCSFLLTSPSSAGTFFKEALFLLTRAEKIGNHKKQMIQNLVFGGMKEGLQYMKFVTTRALYSITGLDVE